MVEELKEEEESDEPKIENIGINGSHRFSDINLNELNNNNNTQESLIVFNPKKEINEK